MAADTEAGARASASAIVEEKLGGPVALVVGDVVRLYTDDQGTATLPMKPVVSVTQVQYDTGAVQDITTVTVDGTVVSGLPRTVFVRITYTHGWTDQTVPPIVRTILDRVQKRLMNSPDDAVRAESIGSYHVDYITDPRWLTPDEEAALSRHRRTTAGKTASSSTRPMGASLAPAFWGGEGMP